MGKPLKILFVINDLYTRGNGLAASARRTIALLRERGHHVRVLSAPPRGGDECGIGFPDYPLPPLRVPIIASLIASQGYAFARVDRAQIKRALDWADVVHLEEPFFLAGSYRALRSPMRGSRDGDLSYPSRKLDGLGVSRSPHVSESRDPWPLEARDF